MAPMLVMRFLHNTDLETKELVAVRAFQWGAAKPDHYHTLVDMVNLLILAGSSDDKRTYAKDRAERVYLPALETIKTRFDKTGKLGVSATELKLMLEMVEFQKQFWLRQPSELYHTACNELQAFYDELGTRRAAERGAAA